MDIRAAQSAVAPWIAVGVLLALAGLLLAGLVAAVVVRRRRGRPPADRRPVDAVDDDLPGFLESPPGSAPAATVRDAGVVPLTAPPPPAPAPSTLQRVGGRALAALAGVVVLLLVAAVVVGVAASTSRDRDGRDGRGGRDASADGPARAGRGPDGTEARMRFAGLVLQQQAVGITVTYPEVELTAEGDAPVVRLTLPTWNCLSIEAPEDPEAAGCRPGRTEYAELRPPALDVTEIDGGMRLAGEFPTSTRPTGGAPEPTGRTYRIEATATPDRELRPGRWSPAAGTLVLEDHTTQSVDGELRVGH